MKKVLEIRVTQESPLQLKSIVHELWDESQKLLLDSKFNKSDTFGPQENEAITDAPEETLPKPVKNSEIHLLETQIKDLSQFPSPDYENLKLHIKLLEDLIIKKREKDGEEFMSLCKKNEELKKSISKLNKELNADKTNLKKIYEKRIFELRKEENLLKTDAFNVKQRIYNLELESAVYTKELEELSEELRKLTLEKSASQSQLVTKNAKLSESNEELTQENKRLSSSSQFFISQLNAIFLNT